MNRAADPDLALAEARRGDDAADLAFQQEEVPVAITETLAGVERVVTIVQAMKIFGHPGGDTAQSADLNEAVRVTLVVASSQIGDVAAVVTEFGDLPPLTCHIGSLNQVLLNLLLNAAHAIGEVPKTERAPGIITVRTRAEGDEIVIEVADNGCGIPAGVLGRIFDPFFTTKAVGVGTGQGLAIVHAIIRDRHHGSITVASQVGEGTTFSIRLPVQGRAAGIPGSPWSR